MKFWSVITLVSKETGCARGGGYGEYSYWLALLGYEVYLYDISKKNIEMSYDLEKEESIMGLSTHLLSISRKE